jgi:hypothetical protein
MTVIRFEPRVGRGAPLGWTPEELAEAMRLYGALSRRGVVADWETGSTEYGDPQFYMLSPDEQACVRCLTRLGTGRQAFYVLEDGAGTVLGTESCLETLVTHAVRRTGSAGHLRLVARAILGLFGVNIAKDELGEPRLAFDLDGWLLDSLAELAPYAAAMA